MLSGSPWHDVDGLTYSCTWYEDGDTRCESYGSNYAKDDLTANQACCGCGGGNPGTEPTAEPTASPTDAPTAEPTASPTDAPTEPPTDPPTDYVLGKLNTKCHSIAVLEDSSECFAAGATFGKIMKNRILSKTWLPIGCSMRYKGETTGYIVFWNKSPTGNSNKNFQPVCLPTEPQNCFKEIAGAPPLASDNRYTRGGTKMATITGLTQNECKDQCLAHEATEGVRCEMFSWLGKTNKLKNKCLLYGTTGMWNKYKCSGNKLQKCMNNDEAIEANPDVQRNCACFTTHTRSSTGSLC